MNSSYHATFIRLQTHTNSPKSSFCEKWPLKNCQNLKCPKCVFCTKTSSQRTEHANSACKMALNQKFPKSRIFQKYANPKTTIQGIEIWQIQSYQLVINQEIRFMLGNRAIPNFQSYNWWLIYNPDCNNYFFKKNTKFANLESGNSLFHTSFQKTVKNRTNKFGILKKFNAQKTTIHGMLHILFNQQNFEEKQEISK